MKLHLVEYAADFHKLWSVRLSAFGAGVMALFAAWPDSALALWSVMPAEVRELLPEQIVPILAAVIFVMTAVSRIIRQRNVGP